MNEQTKQNSKDALLERSLDAAKDLGAEGLEGGMTTNSVHQVLLLHLLLHLLIGGRLPTTRNSDMPQPHSQKHSGNAAASPYTSTTQTGIPGKCL
jgi:hypothetical protein